LALAPPAWPRQPLRGLRSRSPAGRGRPGRRRL